MRIARAFFCRRANLTSGAGTPESEPMPENLCDIVLIEDSASEAALTRTYLENDFCRVHLRTFPWSGNVRKMENAIRYAVIMVNNNVIDLPTLAPAVPPAAEHMGRQHRRLDYPSQTPDLSAACGPDD